jgi:phytol kinase
MSSRDVLGLILSYVYVFAVIGVGEGLRRWRGYSPEFSRKVIHIGVGLWSIGTVLLFDNRLVAMIPPLSFVALNYVSYRLELVKAMDSGERKTLGTVYFPIAFLAVLFLLWDQKPLAVAALMPLALGDAFAAILGRPYGQIHYTIFGRQRSVEGSLTMFVVSFVSVVAVLVVLPALLGVPRLGWGQIALDGLATALLATATEALTPFDMDNLSVPAVSALALWLLSGLG